MSENNGMPTYEEVIAQRAGRAGKSVHVAPLKAMKPGEVREWTEGTAKTIRHRQTVLTIAARRHDGYRTRRAEADAHLIAAAPAMYAALEAVASGHSGYLNRVHAALSAARGKSGAE